MTSTVDPPVGDASPVTPAAVRFEQRDGRVYVVDAPPFAQFHHEWLASAARERHATIVGLDVVIHAANGDFHYRHEADLGDTILMRRVDV